MLAGPGMKGLTDLAGEWAVLQGRKPRDDEDEGRARVEVEEGGGADMPPARSITGGTAVGETELSDEEKMPSPDPQARSTSERRRSGQLTDVPAISMKVAHSPQSATTPNLYSPPLLSTPVLSQHRSVSPSPSLRPKGEDPFSQQPSSPPLSGPSRLSTPPRLPPHQPFHSVPELSSHSAALRRRENNDRQPPSGNLLATYSLDAQRQLLRSHYCRTQVRFLLLLEDISNRLLVVPKPARVSALRAELTSLNHNLPAEVSASTFVYGVDESQVCMPLWCAADHSHEEGGETPSAAPLRHRGDHSRTARKRAHSRVVRISPGDSVVLNSAERAPFLLHVEVLEGDLDFDPIRRENRDLLKKIVVQEDLRRRKAAHPFHSRPSMIAEGFGAPMPDVVPPTPERYQNGVHESHTRGKTLPAVSRKDVRAEEVEEMDLVEQLYGAKLSVRDALPELSDSIPLPFAPKNKQIDLAAWDRIGVEAGSRRPSIGTPNAVPSTPTLIAPVSTLDTEPSIMDTPDTPGILVSSPTSILSPKRIITLEDYSERMRTAAVMLAQLNASLIPAIPESSGQPSSTSSALSWIPGTGWITGSKDLHNVTDPSSAGGKLKLAAVQAAAIRERIMEEMLALEEERVERMTDRPEGVGIQEGKQEGKTAEDEGIVRRELNKADPSGMQNPVLLSSTLIIQPDVAAVFKESWTAKKSRIRASSPWGHLANWDVGSRGVTDDMRAKSWPQVISVIVKTGTDLRQEQLATQLTERFSRIFKEANCDCWVRLSVA